MSRGDDRVAQLDKATEAYVKQVLAIEDRAPAAHPQLASRRRRGLRWKRPQRSAPQLPMSFARPQKTKGGLVIDDYRELVERLRADAARVAAKFSLPRFDLDADRPDAHDRYGVCDENGRIRVRLVHARTGRVLRYSALIDTVVHELAHLRHMDHGPRWESAVRTDAGVVPAREDLRSAASTIQADRGHGVSDASRSCAARAVQRTAVSTWVIGLHRRPNG